MTFGHRKWASLHQVIADWDKWKWKKYSLYIVTSYVLIMYLQLALLLGKLEVYILYNFLRKKLSICISQLLWVWFHHWFLIYLQWAQDRICGFAYQSCLHIKRETAVNYKLFKYRQSNSEYWKGRAVTRLSVQLLQSKRLEALQVQDLRDQRGDSRPNI